MDFIEILSIILPVLASLGIFCVIVINLYKKIRMKFPVNVNCWFCNEWIKVEYDLQNCWDCPNCEQYNGFTTDGDYNKTISAQHDEFLNTPILTKTKLSPMTENGLCNICNNNQRLKIHQLAVFSPMDDANYDDEIEKYRQQLERAYPLCPQCEKTVTKTLRRQKSMLLGLKLSDLRKNGNYLLNLSFPDDFRTAKKVYFSNMLKILIFIITIIQIVITARKLDFIKKYEITLPENFLTYLIFIENIFSIFTKIIFTFSEYFYYLYNFTVINNSLFVYVQRYMFDFSLYIEFINVYFWKIFNLEKNLAINILGMFLELAVTIMKQKVTKVDYSRLLAWNFNIFSSCLQVFEYLQFFACIFLIIFKSSKNITKIEKVNFSNSTFTSTPQKISRESSTYIDNNPENNIFKGTENPKLNFNPPLNPLNFSSLYPAETTPIFGQKPIFDNPLTFKNFRNTLDNSFSENKSVHNESLNLKFNELSNSKLNESLNSSFNEPLNETINFNGDVNLESSLYEGLNKLHLSTYRKEINSNELPSAFRISNISRPKPVLSPPKLGNLTHSSWLAGGYWKNGDYLSCCSNLSRSSSQSSGFGSQASSQNLDVFNSLPPSRNTSVCGEFDKFSVFSEPAYHYNPQNKYINNGPPQNVKNRTFTASNENLIADSLISNKYFVPIPSQNLHKSHFSTNESVKHSLLPISTQNIKKPTLNSSNDNFWTSHKPNCQNITSEKNNKLLVSSVIYKSNNGYVKGSLLQKWREQNCVD